jgi:hypothetical protein
MELHTNDTPESESDVEESNSEKEISSEHRELLSRLNEELLELSRTMPEKELNAIRERALELFALRCEIQDLKEEPNTSLVTRTHAEYKAEKTFINEGALKSDYNIDHPDRYPPSILKEMLDSSENSKPGGVMVVAKYDHNGAFNWTDQLFGLHADLGGRYAVRIVEAESAEVAGELLRRLGQKYGICSFGVCLAHGLEDGFMLEDTEEGEVRTEESETDVKLVETEVQSEMLLDVLPQDESNKRPSEPPDRSQLHYFTEAFAQITPEGATLVLESCSTGGGSNSIGRQIAKITHRKVIAPGNVVYGVQFNAEAVGNTVMFDPKYDGATAKEFTTS